MSSVGQLVPPATRPPNMSVKVHGPRIEGFFCSLIDYNYDPIISVMCAMYIVFGIVYTLFGYRCFKASMFLTGFTFGSAIVYLICLQEYLMPSYGNVGVALCAGLLFGLITMLIQYVGLFITGFHTGLLLALAGLAIYDHFLEARPTTYWLCVVTLLVSGIFFAVLNLYWKKVLTVLGTSVYGGAVIATCVDYFLERMIMLKWLWERAKLEPVVPPPCRLSWLALCAWPAAAIVGLVTQAALTAAGTHHEQSISAQKRRLKAAATRPVTREQRAELKQRKYRYLYQVRTAHGDVISQSYVQALQKKAQCNNWSEEKACGVAGGACGVVAGAAGGACGVVAVAAGGECSTLQSDCTHLTVLAGSELAHHTDSDDDLDQIRAAH